MSGQEGLSVPGFGAKGQEAAQAEAEAWAGLLEKQGVDLQSLLSGEISREVLAGYVGRPAEKILMDDAKAGARILLARRGTHDAAMRRIDN